MRLHQLSNVPGAVHRRKRIGCGEGSGRGKTSGRGGKGQTARSGGSIRPGFEGGQMPLYRKLPHRGFNQARFRTEFSILNISDLAALDPSVTTIDHAKLVELGVLRRSSGPLKILGQGELDRALTVTAAKFSASAKAKLEAAGGQAETA
ncbi:MAG: 50S ribosomal protein L15 [Puniceicoccaceae bacterium]|nr:MAG: 50S ribosomal protein L15 [Puniceicoccaceae bacterium]